MSLEDKLDRVVDRHKELESLLSEVDATDSQSYAKLSKEYSDLTPVVASIKSLKDLRKEYIDLSSLLKDGDLDSEMKLMAETELQELKGREPEIEKKLQIMLLPQGCGRF